MVPESSPTPQPATTPVVDVPSLTEVSAPDRSTHQFGPKIAVEYTTMRDILARMPAADLAKVMAHIDDPQTMYYRAATDPTADLSPAAAKEAAQTFSEFFQLSREGAAVLQELSSFYYGYLRPFPDKSEVEQIGSLLGYIKDLPTWDVFMAKDPKTGEVIAACSGQIVDIPCASGDFKIAWNEHTWVDANYRRNGLGEIMAGKFTEKARDYGAIGVVIEADNPFLMTTDPGAFNHADPAARMQHWLEVENSSMDPFQRAQFWGKQGMYLLVTSSSDGDMVAAPYYQISMDRETVNACNTLGMAFQPLDPEYKSSLPKENFAALVTGLQQTIDEHALFYPELQRAQTEIAAIPGETLSFVRLDDPRALTAMERAKARFEGCNDVDLKYCEEKLQKGGLSSEESTILSERAEFLRNNKYA